MKKALKRLIVGVVALVLIICIWQHHQTVKISSKYLLNITNFRYIIDQKSCQRLKIHPLALIVVHSAPGNAQKRRVIRETWGSFTGDTMRVIFLLGTTHPTQQMALQDEARLHGDLLQGNFIDDYRNLTYKHTMGLLWSSRECPEAEFVIKVDDDVFVNSPALLGFLAGTPIRDIQCTHLLSNPVIRNVNSPWYVSPEEFANATYPRYCSGCGIIYPRNVIGSLLRAVNRLKFFWIDDVFVSGIAREMAGVAINEIDNKVLQTPLAEEIASGNANDSLLDQFLYSNEVAERVLRTLWHKSQLRTLN
ncbi:acetylgalactosaminyl-O-glycosyl-glycoprotein beta-1,3-N-acetylglucosaminyltransferase-like isoform X1 [Phlebotomus papatasi]|uniref:acetylgalactosaminyl-O-glycosyl-glycoprotein beta-1,3-N-acetylglucosaminyltransferase-like isoform X1 n=1 Tax=Phlebotomus papatasi TaxID=29031 RepID=UPI00248347D7|nr:acetylgalactosaminyl-O-glycosyl-glycoprotein beta-1,3-N-acetylglucosaminyltransferase-like isoform X1 [Phlebotomus papatasi]